MNYRNSAGKNFTCPKPFQNSTIQVPSCWLASCTLNISKKHILVDKTDKKSIYLQNLLTDLKVIHNSISKILNIVNCVWTWLPSMLLLLWHFRLLYDPLCLASICFMIVVWFLHISKCSSRSFVSAFKLNYCWWNPSFFCSYTFQ